MRWGVRVGRGVVIALEVGSMWRGRRVNVSSIVGVGRSLGGRKGGGSRGALGLGFVSAAEMELSRKAERVVFV